MLGKGSFGEVIKARHLLTHDIVAIKMIKKAYKDDYAAKKLITEIQILRFLSE